MKEDYQKALKKLTLFFHSNPVPFNGHSCQKQKGSRTSDQLPNKFKNILLFVIYYLTKFGDVMESSYWVIPKNKSANLCKSIDDLKNYSTPICPFESENCGEEEKKIRRFEYLENHKSFLNEKKNTFYSFYRALIWCKKLKNW